MKQNLTKLKGEIGNSAIIANLNTPFSIIIKTTRQKINKDIEGYRIIEQNYKPNKP